MTRTPRIPEMPDSYRSGYLNELDGRSTVKQAMAARYITFTNDLGGADRMSYAQRSLVERALFLEFQLSQQEKSLAAGLEVDMTRYVLAVNSLQGLFNKVGLKKRAKDLDLNEYIQNQNL